MRRKRPGRRAGNMVGTKGHGNPLTEKGSRLRTRIMVDEAIDQAHDLQVSVKPSWEQWKTQGRLLGLERAFVGIP